MKTIQNIDKLLDLEGEPLEWRQKRKGFVTTRTEEGALVDKDGKIVTGDDLLENVTPSLARWFTIILNMLPRQILDMDDSTHIVTIIRACQKSDATGKVAKTPIELEEADFKWLKEILFDNGRGKEIAELMSTPQNKVKIAGAWCVVAVGPVLTVLLKERLDEAERLKLVEKEPAAAN